MLGHMKIQAQSASYNVGYKTKIKMYEEIAKNPEKILALVENLCQMDEERGTVMEETGFTFRETLDAVSFLHNLLIGIELMN
jgi:hypothetical protein